RETRNNGGGCNFVQPPTKGAQRLHSDSNRAPGLAICSDWPSRPQSPTLASRATSDQCLPWRTSKRRGAFFMVLESEGLCSTFSTRGFRECRGRGDVEWLHTGRERSRRATRGRR